MKPKLVHKEAMEYSFKAKQALEEKNFDASIEFYKKSAELESEVAKFYFDKPELEPTRSIIIRSAAFLNLKAGEIEKAQEFIFFGLLNTKDEIIKQQLNDALEISISLKSMNPLVLKREYNYLNILRQNSVHYTLEPKSLEFGHSVSLSMIKDFTDNYLKSLKAYALSKLKKIKKVKANFDDQILKEIDNIVNPLVTNSSYGSFKFSIANDFLKREDETSDIVEIKTNIISNYHKEIFVNPLDNYHIDEIKEEYNDEEINEIFRPLTKIKSNNSDFNIGYFDTDNFSKIYIPKIVNNQRKQLLTTKTLTPEDIGELVNTITHKRISEFGKISRKTISSEEFKSYEKDIKLKEIQPKDFGSIILNEEILVNMIFDLKVGFTFSFDDFNIDYTNIDYEKAFLGFNNKFYEKIKFLLSKSNLSNEEQQYFKIVSGLIGNIDLLK